MDNTVLNDNIALNDHRGDIAARNKGTGRVGYEGEWFTDSGHEGAGSEIGRICDRAIDDVIGDDVGDLRRIEHTDCGHDGGDSSVIGCEDGDALRVGQGS